jgi:putative FmdB family regulatory protein
MPLYSFRCTECSHEFEHSCKIAEKDKFLHGSCPQCSHPEIKQLLTKLNLGDSVRMGVTKVPLEFKERVLDKIDHAHPNAGGDRKLTTEIGSH